MPQRTRRAGLSKQRAALVAESANAAPDEPAGLREASGNSLRGAEGSEASRSGQRLGAAFSARLKSCPDTDLGGGRGRSAGRRVLAVLVLTPALICFMSRKDVDHAPRSFPAANRTASAGRHATPHHVAEEWPSAGFLPSGASATAEYRPAYARESFRFARSVYESDPRAAGRVYARAMFLARRYDSRPYWKARKLEVGVPTDRATADLAIEHLIPCESMGRAINRIDANGKMSYGILQFQDWNEWEAASGLRGDPDNRQDAIRMGEWAIQNGMINRWTCAQILKMM